MEKEMPNARQISEKVEGLEIRQPTTTKTGY